MICFLKKVIIILGLGYHICIVNKEEHHIIYQLFAMLVLYCVSVKFKQKNRQKNKRTKTNVKKSISFSKLDSTVTQFYEQTCPIFLLVFNFIRLSLLFLFFLLSSAHYFTHLPFFLHFLNSLTPFFFLIVRLNGNSTTTIKE